MTNRGGRDSIPARIWLGIVGVVIVAAGLFFVIGGVRLLTLGGSAYFAIAGFVLVASGVLLVKRRALGAQLYLLTLLGTAIWALWDVGFQFWPLVSRLMAMAVGGVFVAASLPLLKRAGSASGARKGVAFAISGVLALGCLATFAGMFVPHDPIPFEGRISPLIPIATGHEQKNWEAYGNTTGGSRFVALNQINRGNVKNLKVAWMIHTGDMDPSDGNGAEDQDTPLQVGDTVYICTPHNNVLALDADTGKTKWEATFNAHAKVWMRCRGLAYFDATRPIAQPTVPGSSPILPATVAPGDPCQRRIFMNTIDDRLVAIDADTGKLCRGFGDNGVVDLKAGMGAAPDPEYELTSPPTLSGTTIVVGGRVADNVKLDMPGGVIRGFDVITGKMRWAFDPGNPADKSAPAPGRTYVRSTPNSWAPATYDPASNTVFLPMGSSSVDVYGVPRTRLDHEFGASILAVDATTGKEKWDFQTVHNDLWDFDIPMQPSFVDFPTGGGKTVPAVIFGTKAGQIYVLDRRTGKPLTKVVETRVKPANIPGEPYAPTQPRSVGMPQIGAQTLTESDMWGATPFDQLLCRIQFKKMRYNGLYTAPGTDLSLSFPGSLGGMNWGGVSIDPTTDTLFVNDMRLGLWSQMIRQAPKKGQATSDGGEAVNAGMGAVPMAGTPYAVNKNRFMSALGIPCQAPPFGTLSAIDLKTRKIKWQVPVGTVKDTGPGGIPVGLPIPIGMPTLGGTLATQGGLVFIAGTQDFYLRAFDAQTGKVLWKGRLPVGSQGGPMSYVSPKTGKQYILVTAGGARQNPKRGDYVIAYSLP